MTRVDFVSFDPRRPGWNYSFRNPRASRTARRPEDVEGLLQWAEDQRKSGCWVALALAYEAARALNPELPAGRSGPEPLAWAAAFPRPTAAVRPPRRRFSHTPWRPGLKASTHHRSIARIKSWIARGDTYQVNHTFPLTSRFSGDARSWFWSLGPAQGAPYAAFIDAGRWKWLSLSPELFFEKKGPRVVLRPMKGSAPRGRWPAEDDAFAERLARSPKDRAENLMIVDLLRNDLGKIARPGTIRARPLFVVEKYPTVHQMTSTLSGRPRPGVGWRECLAALFPSGSVTGAPKRRTMEIIRRLESTPRGFYTGAIGFLRPDGSGEFNVAIRTIVLDGNTGRARCGVGAGVTWGSSAPGEWRESLLKGEFLNLPDFHLIESLRLEEGRFPLKEWHWRRVRSSARRFGFVQDRKSFDRALARLAAGRSRGVWKARLLLGRDGRWTGSVESLPAAAAPWRVALSTRAVDDRDPFLFHKTTRRSVYDAWAADRPGADEVVGWNRRGELTEGTRTNVVLEIGGRLFTPPVSAGLLAGVYRGALLGRGQIRERVLRKSDWRKADRVWLINAVRGWIPARRHADSTVSRPKRVSAPRRRSRKPPRNGRRSNDPVRG